ncbi:hypothetical protein [Enterococcus sp. LJL90]
MKNNSLKQVGTCLLYAIIPIIIGIILSLLINQDWHLTTMAIFVIFIFFLIPKGGLFSSSVDYQTRSVNPEFQPKHERISAGTWEIIHLLSVVLAAFVILLEWTISAVYF